MQDDKGHRNELEEIHPLHLLINLTKLKLEMKKLIINFTVPASEK